MRALILATSLFLFTLDVFAAEVWLRWHPAEGVTEYVIQQSGDCGSSWYDVDIAADGLILNGSVIHKLSNITEVGIQYFRVGAINPEGVLIFYASNMSYCGDCGPVLLEPPSGLSTP